MDKHAVTNIYPDVTGKQPGFEKHQVAALQLIAGNASAVVELAFGVAGEGQAKLISIGQIHQPGAVDPVGEAASAASWRW